ncbi:MAG: hypothetical protein IKN11_07285 [Bacteroidales bacterium]|nr:hypothetical protein [Bacteroidales bacterium]
MISHKHILVFFSLIAISVVSFAQSAIGEWQDHNSFVSARHLCVTPNRVYAATRMAMFYYDKTDSSVHTMTKVGGLSDVGISAIAYDEHSGCLSIAYANSGVDIIQGESVHHIADIHYGNMGGDKKIYQIRFDGSRIFLATGFGIVMVDANRQEIAETYYIGPDGESGVVYDVAVTDSLIYAGTDNGLMYAPKHSNRLHIFETWTRDTLSPLAHMSVRMLEVSGNRIVAAACTDNPDSMTVFYQAGADSWNKLGSGKIQSIRCRHGRTLLNRFNSVELYDNSFSPLATVNNLPLYGVAATDADIDSDGTLWLGHPWAGMLQVPQDYESAISCSPQGPNNDDYVYSVVATSGKVYLCPGGKKPTYESALLPGGLSIFENGRWSQVSRAEGLPDFQDVLYMAVDPKNRKHLSATSWGYGVLDIHDNVIETIFDQSNTSGVLTPFSSDSFSHLRVSGLAYDRQGNLWVTNSLVNRGLAVRYSDGSWQSFDISPLFQGLAKDKMEIDKLIWDSITGYKWFIGKGNRIYVHDGVDKLAFVNPNNGSKLETHTVTCLVQDRSGDLWFGTDKGLKVIYDGYRAFSNGGKGEVAPVNCSNILYNEDGINEYLMAYESITCMAVDGANRKWVGTSNNGLYLISANGLEQLHHFTTANSHLASDKIVSLAVHPESGVVFIGTDMGLQSYRSTATVGYSEPLLNIHAFPNPVRPGYDGPIAIKGFTRDALVHITDTRGHVVFSTTAHGGQAIWNGHTLNGTPVASGTYFVFASDASGNMRSVTKILIIR